MSQRKPVYPIKYTAVQHSGFGFGGKPDFQHGLEPLSIGSKKDEALVQRSGGLVFGTYKECDAYCHEPHD